MSKQGREWYQWKFYRFDNKFVSFRKFQFDNKKILSSSIVARMGYVKFAASHSIQVFGTHYKNKLNSDGNSACHTLEGLQDLS